MTSMPVSFFYRARAGIRLVRQGHVWRDLSNVLRYGWHNAPRTFERIWIEPHAVRLVVSARFSREDSGRVIGGDWDLQVHSFAAQPKVVACHRHFLEGVPWEQTGVFEMMLDRIARHGHFDDCRSLEDVVRRYQGIDELYHTLSQEKAIKTQQELSPRTLREKGGIHIHIGRNGEALFAGGGFHRLAIAQVLGMPLIPAQLGVVHEMAATAGIMRSLRHPSEIIP